MEKVKYCPKCQKVHPIDQEKCDCGYEFVKKEEPGVDATVATSNTKVIVDNTPLGLWSFIGFISLSIAGWILMFKFRKTYPERSKAAKKGAIGFYIFAGIILIIALIVILLDKQGKVIWK